MKSLKLLILLLPALAGAAVAAIPLVLPEEASAREKLAAEELRVFLAAVYPSEEFPVVKGGAGEARQAILLGTVASRPALLKRVEAARLQSAESYQVVHFEEDGRQRGVILGADESGLLYGVFGLLEKLGCGFYLTDDFLPDLLPGRFDFSAWNLSDRPLVASRMVFNWHNFLSGCTGWNLTEWQQWITNSQRMGFNTIMVHAYGNNPMLTFSFGGRTKPVGYYGTSRRGRDWGREHVNDVRRLPGGEIFEGPEFGAEAALVPDEKRVASAQNLMKQVFAHAERRGVRVCFAIDVDTGSVLPQEMILDLPEKARFSNGGFWLPRPDRDEGYAFYKAQVESLLGLYPQIDTLALWRRSHGAEWGKLKNAAQLPADWQQEFEQHVQANPAAAKLPQAVCSFALSKVTAAFRRALDEAGRRDVTISMGSWGVDWVPALAEFLPDEVTIMPLDSSLLRYREGSILEVPDLLEDLRKGSGRVTPIIWAHHDDGEYLGRPIHAHESFHDTLAELEACGYGIIHWMNRPLDLYFRNHERQVWQASRNEPVAETCRQAGLHWFGPVAGKAAASYLQDWWTDAPIYGRVTTNHFFLRNEYIPEPDKAIAGCRERIAFLEAIDASELNATQGERFEYFKALERINISFCQVHEQGFRPAKKALQEGDRARAGELLLRHDPVATIRDFSRLSRMLGGDRGEEAMVLSLGTRWLTDHLAARQSAGVEPVRINYGTTSFEPLAQSPGAYTFHLTPNGEYWAVHGAAEMKLPLIAHPAERPIRFAEEGNDTLREIAQTGILVRNPVELTIGTLVGRSHDWVPGEYRIGVWLGPESGGKGCAVRLKNDVVRKLPDMAGNGATVHFMECTVKQTESGPMILPVVPKNAPVVIYGLTMTPLPPNPGD